MARVTYSDLGMVDRGRPTKARIRLIGSDTKPTPAKTMNKTHPGAAAWCQSDTSGGIQCHGMPVLFEGASALAQTTPSLSMHWQPL